MSTLQVVRLRDVVRVTDVSGLAQGVEPLTITIRGDDFRNAEEVLINDVASPSFIVVNNTTILAELPTSVSSVQNISVRSSEFTFTAEASKIDFKMGDKTRSVDGILRLTQLYTLWLLKSPGTDIFSPDTGGGLQDVIGVMNSTARSEPLLAAVASAVQRTNEQIRRMQLNYPNIPLNERLLDGFIEDVRLSGNTDSALLRVRIENFSGDGALSNITL